MGQQKKSDILSGFAQRLRAIRTRRGWTQEDLAEKLGVSASAVGNWESQQNPPSRRRITDIAAKLGVSFEFLVGEEPPTPPELRPPELRALVLNDAMIGSEVSVPSKSLRMVPVVSFARAGQNGFDYEDLGTHFDDWVPTTSNDPNAFALRVEGDSMESRYSPGDILVVTPNEEPRNGDLVVARLEKTGGVLFKLYHQTSGDRVRLTSYNKDLYPPLEFARSEFRFIYPIVNVMSNPRGRP